MSDRPFGVRFVGILQLLDSLTGLLMVLITVQLTNRMMAEMPQKSWTPANSDLPLGVIIFWMISPAIGFLLSYGLFTLKRWAWLGTIIWQGFGALDRLAGVLALSVSFTSASRDLAAITLFMSLAIIYYLFRPEVKRVFGRA